MRRADRFTSAAGQSGHGLVSETARFLGTLGSAPDDPVAVLRALALAAGGTPDEVERLLTENARLVSSFTLAMVKVRQRSAVDDQHPDRK